MLYSKQHNIRKFKEKKRKLSLLAYYVPDFTRFDAPSCFSRFISNENVYYILSILVHQDCLLKISRNFSPISSLYTYTQCFNNICDQIWRIRNPTGIVVLFYNASTYSSLCPGWPCHHKRFLEIYLSQKTLFLNVLFKQLLHSTSNIRKIIFYLFMSITYSRIH